MSAISMFEKLGFKVMLINEYHGYYIRYMRGNDQERYTLTEEIIFEVTNEVEPTIYFNSWKSTLGRMEHCESIITKDIMVAINQQYNEIINGYTKRKRLEDEMQEMKATTDGKES